MPKKLTQVSYEKTETVYGAYVERVVRTSSTGFFGRTHTETNREVIRQVQPSSSAELNKRMPVTLTNGGVPVYRSQVGPR